MSGELFASKVVVLEEEPRVRGIPSGSTSVAGAVGITERGPIAEPVLCTSFEDYLRTFGGFTANSDLALAAAGFFENGGTALWVVRTVHFSDPTNRTTSVAAKATGFLLSGATQAVRLETLDAGTFGNRVQVEVRRASNGVAAAFDLLVIEDGAYRESFPNLTLTPTDARYVQTVVNSAASGSTRIRVTDLRAAGVTTLAAQTVTLTGGNDGLTGLVDADFIGTDAGKTGLFALNAVQDLSLLLVPGRATPAVHLAMLRYCEDTRGGFTFAVLDPPAAANAVGIVDYVTRVAAIEGASEFGAIYWPRLKVLNPARSVYGSADTIVVPPSGVVAGVMARTDGRRPGGVYDPPAGIENGRMSGVLGFETDEVLEEAKRDLVYPRRINPLTTGPGLPRFVDGSRTLKATGNFPYVSERRGVSFIERSLKTGLEFARHRNNNETLRSEVRRVCTAFLITQMNNGAFRTRDPATAFFVDAESLNTPTEVFAGRLHVRIGLATNKPAEFIVLRFSQDTRLLESELAQG
jgi:phage tail sheath protein FI